MNNRMKPSLEKKKNKNDNTNYTDTLPSVPPELVVTQKMIEVSKQLTGGSVSFSNGRNSFYFSVPEENVLIKNNHPAKEAIDNSHAIKQKNNHPAEMATKKISDKLPKTFMKDLFPRKKEKKTSNEDQSYSNHKRSHSCGW